ncbi:Bypass of stop codon protein 6 [Cytospora mali]|uniref:Bypass of stop codon protein 6 n=1 Tax=Cytospora mali TaxID=578113 RepID=A0A194W0Y6_CYTMA|nr:Bypass of stop codon protein 6 [Valsa mali]
MEPPTPSYTEEQPLLRRVPPRPAEDDDQLSESAACVAHEHDTTHERSTSTISMILATLLSFLVLGLIVSTPGVVLPHLEDHYSLSDVQASLIFLVSPVGYLSGAYLNDLIHWRLGQRGIAVIAPICQVLFTGLASSFHDPARGGFEVFLIATVVGNFGNGLIDGSWCAWAGGLGGRRRNTVQGLLHGSFSIGAGLGPFLAGTVFSMWKAPWWGWYYFLLGAVVLQALVLFWAFRFEDGLRYREALGPNMLKPGELDAASEAPPSAFPRGALKHAVTWICAAYFLAYVGTEAAISGWVVTFMLRARHATTYLASLSSSGFWLGMSAGRFLLGPATDKLGVRSATASYLVVAILSQGVLAAVDHAVVSVIAVVLVGFFFGPLYPSGIVMVTRLLPKELHVGAVSFVASVGQLGAAVGPFAMGSLVQLLGIRIFQAFILVMLVVTLLVWFMFPRLPAAEKEGEVRGSAEAVHPSLDTA